MDCAGRCDRGSRSGASKRTSDGTAVDQVIAARPPEVLRDVLRHLTVDWVGRVLADSTERLRVAERHAARYLERGPVGGR